MANEGVELEAWSCKWPLTLITDLPNATNVKYLEELNGPGGGSFDIRPDAAELTEHPTALDYRNIIRVKVDGHYRGFFVVQGKSLTAVDTDGEDAAVLLSVSGETGRTWLKDAVVYPENNVVSPTSQIADRVFSFASDRADSEWYIPADWRNATELVRQDATTGNPWRNSPNGWPDAGDVPWIWDRKSTTSAPAGTCYFRKEFTVTVKGRYAMFIAAADQFDAYVDSHSATSVREGNAATQAQQVDFDLEQGPHVIAVAAHNFGGPAGLLVAVYRYGDANRLAERIVESDSTWKVNSYPTKAPAWTPGEILIKLFAEAADRGVWAFSNTSYDFSRVHDSAGKLWEPSLDWTFSIGSDDYDSVVTKMEELVMDLWMGPDFRWHVYTKKGQSRPSAVIERGGSLTSLKDDETADFKTVALVQNKNGWQQQPGDKEGSYGRLESFVSATDYTSINAARIAAATLTQSLVVTQDAPLTYEASAPGAPVPWADFVLGDTIQVTDIVGTNLTGRRVISISVATDEETGRPLYSLELDNRAKQLADRFDQWIKKMSASVQQFTASTAGSVDCCNPAKNNGSPSSSTTGIYNGVAPAYPKDGDTVFSTQPLIETMGGADSGYPGGARPSVTSPGTTTAAPQGGDVYVLNTRGEQWYGNSLYRFRPSDSSWEVMSRLSVGSDAATGQVMVSDGTYLYSCGGTEIPAAFRYDPTNDSWNGPVGKSTWDNDKTTTWGYAGVMGGKVYFGGGAR